MQLRCTTGAYLSWLLGALDHIVHIHKEEISVVVGKFHSIITCIKSLFKLDIHS